MPLSGTVESALVSSFAAFCAFWFVLYRGHVHVVLADRSTWDSVLHHRCGLAMLLALVWAAMEEAILALAMLRERRQRQARTLDTASRQARVFLAPRAAEPQA